MALNSTQQASYLFKRIFGKSSTNVSRDFFEEPFNGNAPINPMQIWADYAQIPSTAPGGTDGQTTGVVTRYIDKVLTAVPGTTNSFQHADLVDAISFNAGDGVSYNYALKDSAGTSIPFGSGDWIVDPATGVLTFYNTVPANMPPKISFYKYAGLKGAGTGDTVPETQKTLGENVITDIITLDSTKYKTAWFEYQIYRSSSLEEYIQSGTILMTYKPVANTWTPTYLPTGGDEDTKSTWVITAGNISIAANAMTGTDSLSKLTYRVRTLKA